MTTPNKWDGEDVADVPYLPAAQPVSTGPAPAIPDAPYVPPPTPVAPAPSEPVAFDAKAMVESQKHYRTDPAYGALPSGTESGRDAAEKLRLQAQKKRRRNRLVGRAVVLVLLGGVAAAGWFGYQAYQNQQDRDAAERAAAADDEPMDALDAAVALSPLGEQQEIVDGIEVLDDTAQAGAGGLLGAVDDAREVIGETNDGEAASADVASAVVDPFAARTVDFFYRRWEAAAATSPMVEYFYSYDRVADTYLSDIRTDGALTISGTNADSRFAIRPDGVLERVARTAAGLDPAPDIALADVFAEGDVVPPEARPFATLIETNPDTDSGDVFGYTIDTEQWRDRDPGSFLTWVTTWNPRPADDASLVEADLRQVSADDFDTTSLREVAEPEPIAAVVERDVPGAAVTFVVAPEGHLTFATIVDNTADFRIEYVLVGVWDEPALLNLGDRNWVPAP